MEGVRLTICLIIAILLQWTLRNVAEPLCFCRLVPLTCHRCLRCPPAKFDQGDTIWHDLRRLAVDALSGGLLGANGFSKTIIAFGVSEIARRVYMDNLILRIPVIAGACLLNDLIYYGLHRLFGRPISGDILVTAAYSLIGTTIAGTLIYLATVQRISRPKRDKIRLVASKRDRLCSAAADSPAKPDSIE